LAPILFALGCNANGTSKDMAPAGPPDMAGWETYSLNFGPIGPVPAGTENTQCVIERLGNPAPIHVNTMHNILGDASHHMIVYKVNDTVEQKTPFDCQPFTDTLDPSKGSPLVVTQKKDDLLTLPAGVGFSLDANQMVRLELHYINASPNPVMVSASTTMVAMPAAEFKNEAGFLFIGDPDIDLMPMSTLSVKAFFPLPAAFNGVNFFAITGHEHHLGTNVTVETALQASDPGTSVYNVPGWSWSEPATVMAQPPFQIPNGGGFNFECDWNNTTTNEVKFGASANDEMCFFWAYYYPNKGARVCVHTEQYGGQDLCCPDAGQAICSKL
jgi:hypothetical protein